MQVSKLLLGTSLSLAAAFPAVTPILAQSLTPIAGGAEMLHSGQLDVPMNKGEILKVARPFTRALLGNPEIADIMPISGGSLYVLGKKAGTTTLMLYDGARLNAVVDITVGADIVSLRRQLAELMPRDKIAVTMSNDAVVLSGVVSSAPAIDRARQIASTYVGEKIVNLLSVGASQQVMLEVRFSEVARSVGKDIGINHSYVGNKVYGSFGDAAKQSVSDMAKGIKDNGVATPSIAIDALSSTFGLGTVAYSIGSLKLFSSLDALERKGLVKTLAEPTLIALSGETASFLAGGEFPIPVAQSSTVGSTTGSGGGTSGSAITIEFKPFGVGLAFTPTVLDDGVINLVVAPEVSSIDSSASVAVNGLVVPGLQTRRAKTTVELRDGQSFAIAGLLRNDFADTVRQMPVLGSIPIIGSLFRSADFQKGETELVIIVTPRLVKPVNPDAVRLPTERVPDPHELDLFLMGRTDKAVGMNPLDPNAPAPEAAGRATRPPAGKNTGTDGPTGHEF